MSSERHGGIRLDKREYKSSAFDRVLFSFLAVSILMPGIWVILYGIEKREFNWPLVIVGLILCSCMIFILQKFFLYRVVVYDEFMEIHRFDKTISLRFHDIIDIYQRKNACYIIDQVMKDGKYFIRGTNDDAKLYNETDKICISIFKLPVLQRAYIDNYDELIQYICSKIGKENAAAKPRRDRKSSFISAALLKDTNYRFLKGIDVLKMLIPYMMLVLALFATIAEYGIASKGINDSRLSLYAKYVFPVLIILAIFILVVNFIFYFIKLLNKDREKLSNLTSSIVVFIISNFILSAGVIAAFFIVLNNIRL